MNEINKIDQTNQKDQFPVARFPPVALVSPSAPERFTIHH